MMREWLYRQHGSGIGHIDYRCGSEGMRPSAQPAQGLTAARLGR